MVTFSHLLSNQYYGAHKHGEQREYTQGRNEVDFFVTDPIFIPKIVLSDPKNEFWSQNPQKCVDPTKKNTADPKPTRCDFTSQGFHPWSHKPR